METLTMTQGPILVELDADATSPDVLDPSRAPEIASGPDLDGVAATGGQGTDTAVKPRHFGGQGRLLGWLLATGAALFTSLLAITAWQLVLQMIQTVPVLGWALTVLTGIVAVLLLIVAIGEFLALRRTRRLTRIQLAVISASDTSVLALGKALNAVTALYASRREMRPNLDRFRNRCADEIDTDSLMALAHDCLMAPLDARALAEIEQTARRVATVTALVPLGLLDVIFTGFANLRMIRRVAQIYGGRGGVFGSLRLARAVVVHLGATGALAIGDDLLEPVLGGALLSRLSRRFGEGLINGALTSRVGLVAIDLCRPLPFETGRRPKLRGVVGRALAGMVPNGSQGARSVKPVGD
jgi:putative membrane protein